MSSALHTQWEIAFNFVIDIARILISWFQLRKVSTKLSVWAEFKKKRKSKMADNRVFILVIFHTGIWWNNL